MAALDYFFGKGFRFFLFSIVGLFLCAGSGSAQPAPLVPYQVKDINPGSGDSGPRTFISLDKTLYFVATEQSSPNMDFELWKSDGTSEGTSLVKDIHATGNAQVEYLARLNDTTILFSANNGVNGTELWKSDGTAAGTQMVKNINPDTPAIADSKPWQLTPFNNRIFFVPSVDPARGQELWVSDGTEEGTFLFWDIIGGHLGSSPRDLTVANGLLFFAANNMFDGLELCVTDGLSRKEVINIAPNSFNSSPEKLTRVGQKLFFTADDRVHGRELWVSDGTAAGTTMVRDIAPGLKDASPSRLTDVNGQLFFVTEDDDGIIGLWKSDGTEAGTVLVKDLSLVYGGKASSIYLANVNGTLFFSYGEDGQGIELWKSDGTPSGTTLVKDIWPGEPGSDPRELTSFNGKLFFTAVDEKDRELWQSDGTETGTTMVYAINPAGASFPSFLFVNGQTLYFTANDGVHGYELWALQVPMTIYLPLILRAG
jgi:ELWxxDGT repeat protein